MDALKRTYLLLLLATHAWAQTYLGPTHKLPGNPQLVLIEVLVQDSPEPAGPAGPADGQIESVSFGGDQIPLRPRDVYGGRGSASLQKPPGTYTLKWIVERDPLTWPRHLTYKEEVVISPRDLWVQISIVGDKASIN